jgi:hypothetical protein
MRGEARGAGVGCCGGMGGRGAKGEEEGLDASVSSCSAFNQQHLPSVPCGPVGNYNRESVLRSWEKSCSFLFWRKGSKKQFETVTLKIRPIRGPIF